MAERKEAAGRNSPWRKKDEHAMATTRDSRNGRSRSLSFLKGVEARRKREGKCARELREAWGSCEVSPMSGQASVVRKGEGDGTAGYVGKRQFYLFIYLQNSRCAILFRTEGVLHCRSDLHSSTKCLDLISYYSCSKQPNRNIWAQAGTRNINREPKTIAHCSCSSQEIPI